jgi:hypothetical protein
MKTNATSWMKNFGLMGIAILLSAEMVMAQAVDAQPPVADPTPVPPVATQPAPRGIGSYLRPDPISFNARGSMGAAIDPNVFWTALSLEAQLDQFIAFGPTFQFGFGDITNYFMGSIGPRFVLPYRSMEFYVGGGVGFSYRDQQGIQFTNFLMEYQIGAEYYFLQNLSVGLGARMNLISSRAVEEIPVFMGHISGHF